MKPESKYEFKKLESNYTIQKITNIISKNNINKVLKKYIYTH